MAPWLQGTELTVDSGATPSETVRGQLPVLRWLHPECGRGPRRRTSSGDFRGHASDDEELPLMEPLHVLPRDLAVETSLGSTVMRR